MGGGLAGHPLTLSADLKRNRHSLAGAICCELFRVNDGGGTTPRNAVIPAKAGIQYAAAYRFNHWVSGILGHPLSRVTTTGYVLRDSRGAMRPRFANIIRPENKRAQGMPGARCTRGLVCKRWREAHTSIQVQRKHSDIPCAMVLRLMPRSPRRRIRLVTVADGLKDCRTRLGLEKPPPA